MLVQYDADARVIVGAGNFEAVIGAAVIYDEEFEIAEYLAKHAVNALPQIAAVVVAGNDDRHERHPLIVMDAG